MIGWRWSVSGSSCVSLGLVSGLTCRSIKRFYCLTSLCSHITAIITTCMMNMMMIDNTRGISLLLVLLLLDHNTFRRHVRCRCRGHILSHLQSLLCFICACRRLCSVTLILWNEVLENANVISATTWISRIVCSFGTQYWMNHKLVTMKLSMLLGYCPSIGQVSSEFTMRLVIFWALEWWSCKKLLLLLLLLHDVLNVLLLFSRSSGGCSYLLAFLVHFYGTASSSNMAGPVHSINTLCKQVLQCFIFFVEDVKVMIGVLSCLLSVVGLALWVKLGRLHFLSHHHCLSPACGSIAGCPFLCNLRSILGSHYS
jgi:hypothetical protein